MASRRSHVQGNTPGRRLALTRHPELELSVAAALEDDALAGHAGPQDDHPLGSAGGSADDICAVLRIPVLVGIEQHPQGQAAQETNAA